jgi:hypothetical protein
MCDRHDHGGVRPWELRTAALGAAQLVPGRGGDQRPGAPWTVPGGVVPLGQTHGVEEPRSLIGPQPMRSRAALRATAPTPQQSQGLGLSRRRRRSGSRRHAAPTGSADQAAPHEAAPRRSSRRRDAPECPTGPAPGWPGRSSARRAMPRRCDAGPHDCGHGLTRPHMREVAIAHVPTLAVASVRFALHEYAHRRRARRHRPRRPPAGRSAARQVDRRDIPRRRSLLQRRARHVWVSRAPGKVTRSRSKGRGWGNPRWRSMSTS